MGYSYAILGAGRQGVALAYDLALHGEAGRILLADVDRDGANRARARLQTLLPDTKARLTAATCDVSKPAEVAMTISGADVVISAVPYRFNVPLTDAALHANASFCDLGGNTQIVTQQLARHDLAVEAGVSVVPDCGLAPGLGNHLASHGVATMDQPEHVHIRCGGLPQQRVGPLGYKLVFNFQGLVNEYSGYGQFLRDGRLVEVPALSELEPIEFPDPVGPCEAAVTSGGTSTCPESFQGRLQSYDYKTVRYPGHFAIIRAMFQLGCFEEVFTLAGGEILEPKRLMRKLMEEQLTYPDVRDLVVLRCTVQGIHRGRPCTRTYDLMDVHDEATGFTAMERMTAFPAAVVAHMQARRIVAPGARPLELSVPPEPYLAELPAHDVHITVRES